MKALVINETRSHYGFVIEVEQNRDGSYYDSVADLVYEARELQFQGQENPVDWSHFRRETAKDILAGMVANKVYRAHPDDNDEDELKTQQQAAKRASFTAIVYADELIKQLKQE